MSSNYCQVAIYDKNCRNNNAQLNEMSSNSSNLNYSEMISTNESIKPAIYMGDGWCTFPDLDNFDSEKLLRAFTLKEKDSADSIWDPSLGYSEPCHHSQSLSISALRQLEALFNLSQLLFGLSRAETVNYTFRDLQLRKHPHSFKKSGFKQLNTEGRIDFYSVFEKLVYDIIEAGGLEVTLLIYKNPVLPMVRQKCLDLISNVTTVPDVAFKILRQHIWFLDHLLILVRDGEIVSDKIPALSVLIRLLKIMLTERMISAYMKLVDMQYIDSLVDIFENPEYTESAELLPFFIKFEFITMQSLTVILGDAEYSQLWSDKAKTRLLNYCMIVLLKASGAYPTIVNNDQVEQINHIFYAEQHTNKHSLAHTIMTVTELLRNDENMKLFYRYHRPFKQLIIQLYKKYGAKSLYIRTDPGISYALNHLMRVLYIKNTMPNSNASSSDNASGSLDKKQQSSKNLNVTKKKSSEVENKTQQPRTCSNPECKNEETKYKPFKPCSSCNGAAAYCSSRCKKAHISFHLKSECRRDDLALKNQHQPHAYNRIYSSTSTGNYQKNSQANRRTSENLQLKNFQDNYQQQQQQQSVAKRRESSAGQELFYQSSTTNTRKLSKYPSMNENQRRNSVASNMPYQEVENMCLQQGEESNLNRINPVTKNFYAKRSSMKESKSGNAIKRYSAFDDSTNFKIKSAKQIMDDTANSVHFVRPLKTSTALCLPELTRRQSLKDSKSAESDQFKKTDQIKKNSDSSYGSSASSESNSAASGKLIPTKKFKNSTEMTSEANSKAETVHTEDIMDSIIIRRIKKQETLNENNTEDNSVHKRRHSATAAILSSNANNINSSHKAFDDTTKSKHSYPINDSLFYNQNAKQESNDLEKNSMKKNDENQQTSDDNAEHFSKSSSYLSDPGHKSDEYSQVRIQKYKCLEEDEIEEVETKRWSQTNEPNLGCSNEGIESKLHSDLQKDTAPNDLSSVSDDQDLRSTFKVVKEFEKTLQFVNNASNLKVMPSLSINPNEEEQNYKLNGLNAPQISLASLCYDTQMSNKIRNELYDENQNNQESTSSNSSSLDDDGDEESDDSDDEDENQAGQQAPINQMGRNLKGVNLIINNSIDSHMLTNSYMLRDPIQMNDLIMMRKNEQAQKKLSYNDIKQKSNKINSGKLGANRVNSNNHLMQKCLSNENDKKKQIDEVEEEEEFVDDELSLFKNNNTLNTDKYCDFVTFTKPLMYNETKSTSNLYSTKISMYPHQQNQQQQQQNEFQRVRQPSFELKNANRNQQVYVQKHQELKVFDNLSVNVTQQTNAANSTVSTLHLVPELPKNSTPIFTDNATAASLNAKHRQFLNAKLNLTIAPPQSGQQIDSKKPSNINGNNINNAIKQESSKPVFLVPQIPPVNAANEQLLKQKNSPSHAITYKTSTLKSNSNLMMDNMDYGVRGNSSGANDLERKMTHKIMPSDILDVSKISALENATSTNSCVIVTKADMPKDIKKCLKDEIKKDKSKCSIQ